MFLISGLEQAFGLQIMVLLCHQPISRGHCEAKTFQALEHPTASVVGSDLSPIQPDLYFYPLVFTPHFQMSCMEHMLTNTLRLAFHQTAAFK
jgi:hypothetical protein